jgi:iron complex outermembrane receptor protein
MDNPKQRFHVHANALAVLSLLLGATSPHAQTVALNTAQLADLSIEELANIQITSVSRKAQPLADAAASVFVITADDIRRSGYTILPDVLRLAPNLQVAQVSASGYAISARGMNGSNSSAPNKLLVLIDGRSVYSPLFSGVFWDAQDVMLEDVERIEVVSGPAGTLWGVNAVNGVINIITRPARDTQGSLVSASVGNRGNATAFRHGGKLGEDGNYRVYGKYVDREPTERNTGIKMQDAWHRSQIGFRADWAGGDDQWTFSGNAYDGRAGQPAPGAVAVTGVSIPLATISLSGANLTGHWTRRFADESSLSLQAYYEQTRRTVPPTFSDKLELFDVQLQHALAPMGIHSLIWGLNFRQGNDRVDNSVYFAFLPAQARQRWTSFFAQDEIRLSDALRLTVGARAERNDYTGNEFLPSVRLAWKLAPEHLLWTAASRTVRAPSRLDVDAYIPGSPPFLLDGGRQVRSEVARVYEVGYRAQPAANVSYSITVFRNVYDHLRTQEIAPSRTFLTFANGMQGRAHGIEAWGTYQATPRWRLSAGLATVKEKFWLKPGSNDVAGPDAVGKNPELSWTLRSAWDIGANRELNLAVRRVAALSSPDVPAYTAFDARFGWKLRPGVALSIAAQNLFDKRHAEYGPIATRGEMLRSVSASIVWEN